MKTVGVLLLFSSGFLGTSRAAPITYKINFAGSFGTVPTSGSFTYDATAGFSAFIVQWNGITFNLTSAANAPDLGTRSTGCNSRGSTPQYGFIIMDQMATGCNVSYVWGAQSTPPSASFDFSLFDSTAASDDIFVGSNDGSLLASGNGTWSLSSVPEPSTIGAVLFGLIAVIGLMNQRLCQKA